MIHRLLRFALCSIGLIWIAGCSDDAVSLDTLGITQNGACQLADYLPKEHTTMSWYFQTIRYDKFGKEVPNSLQYKSVVFDGNYTVMNGNQVVRMENPSDNQVFKIFSYADNKLLSSLYTFSMWGDICTMGSLEMKGLQAISDCNSLRVVLQDTTFEANLGNIATTITMSLISEPLGKKIITNSTQNIEAIGFKITGNYSSLVHDATKHHCIAMNSHELKRSIVRELWFSKGIGLVYDKAIYYSDAEVLMPEGYEWKLLSFKKR